MSATLFKAGGALTDEHTTIYIERQADRDALTHLRAMDYLLVVEPRQQGKTSLINHLMCHPALDDVAFAYVDVTTPDRSTEATWYRALCPRILRQLRGFIPHDQWPAIPQNSAGWREFLCDVATFVTDAQRRVVIALDEIGAVTFPGATEFFSVLRDVYNSRQAEIEFKQLAFLLTGAFHPRDLIEDDKISPFNIAQRVRLADFTLMQVCELVGKGNWRDERATALTERIYYWTDGQPYLTQLLCSYLGPDATPADVDAGIERLRREDENHLPPILKQLNSDENQRKYVERILTGERIKFYPREHRRQAQLELLGVIKEDAEGYCIVRNRIYEQVLAYRFFSPNVPANLLNFTSDHLLVEQDWQYYGSEKEKGHLSLEYDSGLDKRVLVKRGYGLDTGARYKPPGAPPLGWKYSYYEFLVRLSPESAICIRVQDATGKGHTLVYSSAIPLSESKELGELYIEIDKDVSDGNTWCSLIVNLPAHIKYAQWPGFAAVDWFSLRGEVALTWIRGCDDAETLLASASASTYVVRPASVPKRLPEPVVGIVPREAALMLPSEFAEALQRGSLAFFLGADLPHEITSLPSRADLARELARRKELDESLSLAEVAQRVGQAGNRWEFTAFIRDALDTTGKSPSPFHRRIVELVQGHEIETLITTAYDNLLEMAFQKAGVPINRIVRGSDVSFIDPDRPTLIKLYGDAQQPDTLVVTADDHYGLWRNRDKEDLLHEVRTVLRKQTVLFLGYNLTDPDFNLLWREVLDRAGRFARAAYAVWPGLPEDEVRMWRDRGIVILDDDPLGVLSALEVPSVPAGRPEPQIGLPSSGSSVKGEDMDYELGFRILKRCLAGADAECQSQLATLEERFLANQRAERLFGSSENTRNERSQTIFSLNELALKHCGMSFNEMCQGAKSEPFVKPQSTDGTEMPAPSPSPPRRERASVRFKLQLARLVGLEFEVRAFETLMGEPRATTRLPYGRDELIAILKALPAASLEDARLTSVQKEALRDLGLLTNPDFVSDLHAQVGRALYQSLFPKDVGTAFQMAWNQVRVQRGLVSLQLRFDEDAVDLARYPWELLFYRRHLLPSGALELTRYISYPEAPTALVVESPLRVLYVESRPTDLKSLPVDEEQETVRSALKALDEEGLVVLEELSPPTYKALIARIENSEDHVLHFDGHGTFARRCPACRAMNYPHHATCQQSGCGHSLADVPPLGYLAFEKEGSREVDWVDSEVLETLLYPSTVRVAVLSACRSGEVRGKTLFGGVGPALIQAGVPAVVAMQVPITVQAAVEFMQGFYGALARFESLPAAMTSGRRRLFREREWFIPALYLRSTDDEGYLLKPL